MIFHFVLYALNLESMFIIPAINEKDFKEIQKKLQIASRFSRWVQLDVADGKFVARQTWNNPADVKNIKLNLEIHLMTENPVESIKDWVKAGAKRIIVHWEATKIAYGSRICKFRESDFRNIKNTEIGLAVNPQTPIEGLSSALKNFKFVLILAVEPGLSGQKFQHRVLEKVKFLKKKFPDIIVEVDGGINLETAILAKKEGADIVAVSSFIWSSPNPKIAFEKLKQSIGVESQ